MDTNNVGRSNEPRNISDILAQIMDDLKAGKDDIESNETRKSNQEHSQQRN